MFQRVTVRVKGVITDDVSYYHRLVGTLMNLRPLNSLYSDGPSQLGTGYSDYTQSGVQERWRHCGASARLPNGMILSGPEVDPIPAGQSRVVLFDLPGISLFNSHYLLPIGRFPVELSLELVSDAKLVCATKTLDAAGARLPAGPDADILSTTFTLEDVQIKADTLLLDSAVTANIDEALTQGQAPDASPPPLDGAALHGRRRGRQHQLLADLQPRLLAPAVHVHQLLSQEGA
jgi:hypothetical protein